MVHHVFCKDRYRISLSLLGQNLADYAEFGRKLPNYVSCWWKRLMESCQLYVDHDLLLFFLRIAMLEGGTSIGNPVLI